MPELSSYDALDPAEMGLTRLRYEKAGGRATIAGADLLRAPAEVRDHIGFVAQTSGTYGEATGRRELEAGDAQRDDASRVEALGRDREYPPSPQVLGDVPRVEKDLEYQDEEQEAEEPAHE